jgi:hypothetical protein
MQSVSAVSRTALTAEEKTEKDNLFYRDRQKHIAISVIGPSALRNQGSYGVIKAAQNHLSDIDLHAFRANDETTFLHILDGQTEILRSALPRGARNWGAARKALNLFLRDICYDRFLSEKYRLASAEQWMEIPLDSLTAASLKRKGAKGQLPQWPGLKRLTPAVSSRFQTFAKRLASSQGISRVHLDMRLWAEERERKANKAVRRIGHKPASR